jgi:two-component system chemotaxis response regulator CheB
MTRVLVIDDSALMRELLTRMIGQAPGFEVVGTAPDPIVAWEKIKTLRPDVLTLDVEMPRMDGLTFLGRLMQHHPMPVLMVSSLTERGCATTLQALEHGAIDYVTKPAIDLMRSLDELGTELIAKLTIAAQARVGIKRPKPRVLPSRALVRSTHKVIAIGSSTGGTEALRVVLGMLPADAPGVVIVQHMPATFTHSFAQRLDSLCQVRVKEAETGDRIMPGHVLLAPGDNHLRVVRRGAAYHVEVFTGDRVNRFRPSVDVLFHSCAQELGSNAAAAILTGMGDDGARGMLAMRKAGAHTIAQDEATSVVYGMPRVAAEMGAAIDVLPLEDVAASLLRHAA